ncbi:MAG: AAA family ATPase [Gemmatimonadaceae bacterium]
MTAPVKPGTPEAIAQVERVTMSARDETDRAKHFRPLSEEDVFEITKGSGSSSPRVGPVGRLGPRARPAPFMLGELYAMPELLIPPRAIIPWLAYDASTTLISAREKTGKSTLLGQAIAAGSSGTEFLGQVLDPFRTLWYAIDEPVSDTVRRFQRYGADPGAVTVQPERPTAEEMRAEIEAARADVCVVDTLSRLWRGRIDSANNNDAVADFLWPYIEAVRETGAALILQYHTTKAGREYRGGIELGACVDLPITLRRQGQKQPTDTDDGFDADYDDDSRDDGRRLLIGRGRNVDVKLRLAFDGDRYALGDSPMPLRSRILAELEHEAASATALAELLTTRKDRVLAELRDLRAQGLVQARGAGSRQLYELTRKQGATDTARAEK